MATDMLRKKHLSPEESPQNGFSSRPGTRALNGKRRLMDDDSPACAARHNVAMARRHVQNSRFKKSRTPRISGESLPVNRLIEVLDHAALQNLLQTVMTHHPEIVSTVSNLAPKPSVNDAIELIKSKANNVLAHIPYKCEPESDYSYTRVKTHLVELLNCISDFVLDLLPPLESSLQNSCITLNAATTVLHELPNFSNKEFQYTKAMAYEKIANSWLIILNHHRCAEEGASNVEDGSPAGNVEKSIEWLKTIEEMNLLEQVEKHNEVSSGKFSGVVEFVRSEMDTFAQLSSSLSNNKAGSIFNDLITVDYSGYSISARTSH